jgi:hypothetical protein
MPYAQLYSRVARVAGLRRGEAECWQALGRVRPLNQAEKLCVKMKMKLASCATGLDQLF